MDIFEAVWLVRTVRSDQTSMTGNGTAASAEAVVIPLPTVFKHLVGLPEKSQRHVNRLKMGRKKEP